MGFLDALFGRQNNSNQEEEEKKKKQQQSTGNQTADDFLKWMNGIGDAFRSGLTPSASTPAKPAAPTISNETYNNVWNAFIGNNTNQNTPSLPDLTTTTQNGKITTAGNSPLMPLNENNITGNRRGWGYGSGTAVDAVTAKEWDELLDPNSTRSRSMDPKKRATEINNKIPAWYVNAYRSGTQGYARTGLGADQILPEDGNIMTNATKGRENIVNMANAQYNLRETGRYDYMTDPWGNLADPSLYSTDYLADQVDEWKDKVAADKLRTDNAIHNIEDINDAFSWSYAADQDFTNDKRRVTDIELEGYAKYIEGSDFDPRTATEDERKALTSRYMEWGLDDGVLKFQDQLRNNRTKNDATLTENAGVTDANEEWLNKLQKEQAYRNDFSRMKAEADRDPNFAAKATYTGPLPGKDFASRLYNALHDPQARSDFEMTYDINGAASPITSEGYDLMTPEELQYFSWYAANGRGQEYLDMMKATLQHRNAAVQEAVTKAFATENFGTAALSWGIGRFANLGTAFLYPFQAANAALGGETDAASSLYAPNRFTNDVTEAQTQVIANSNFLQIPGFEPGTNLGTWLYQAATSAADSLLGVSVGTMLGGGSASKLGKALANVVMSSEAASHALEDNLLRGLDPTHALLTSVADGMAEAISETWSIESLLSDPTHFLPYLAKNVFSEASEEGASAILQAIGDRIVNGDNTQYQNDVNALILMGVKPKEANKQVMRAWLNDTLQSAIIGGLSGGMSAGTMGGINAIGEAAAGNRINQQLMNNTISRMTREAANTTQNVQTEQNAPASTEEAERRAPETPNKPAVERTQDEAQKTVNVPTDNINENNDAQRRAPETPDKASFERTQDEFQTPDNAPQAENERRAPETPDKAPLERTQDEAPKAVNAETDNVNENDDAQRRAPEQPVQQSARAREAEQEQAVRNLKEQESQQPKENQRRAPAKPTKENRKEAERVLAETQKKVAEIGATLEEGSEARKTADAVLKKLEKGKRIRGRQSYQLYSQIYNQLGEQNGRVIKKAAEDKISFDLQKAGVTQEDAERMGKNLAEVLTDGTKQISRADLDALLTTRQTRAWLADFVGTDTKDINEHLLKIAASLPSAQMQLRFDAYQNAPEAEQSLDNWSMMRRILEGTYTESSGTSASASGEQAQTAQDYMPKGTKDQVTYADADGNEVKGAIVKITTKAAALKAKSDALEKMNAAKTQVEQAVQLKENAQDKAMEGLSQSAKDAWKQLMQNAEKGPRQTVSIPGNPNGLTMEEFKNNLRNQLSSRVGEAVTDSVNDIILTIRDENGTTHDVSIDDVTGTSSSGVQSMLEYALETPEIMAGNKLNLMFQWYEGEQPQQYMSSFNNVYNAGFSGYIMDPAAVNALGETRAQAIYDAGTQAAAEAERIRKANIRTTLQRGSGHVTVRGIADTDIAGMQAFVDSLDANQKASFDVATVLSKGFGMNFTFFRSETDANGRYTEENGHYNPITNSIALDINAGRVMTAEEYTKQGIPLPQYAILRTAGHEITHYIENNSAEGYAKLRDFVTNELMRRGADTFEYMVAAKQEDYLKAGSPLTREGAIAEVVADSMEMILQDSQAIKRMAAQERTVFERIRDFIHDFVDNIHRAFTGVEAESREARLLLTDNDGNILRYADRLVKLWDDALLEATAETPLDKALGNMTEAAAVQYSARTQDDEESKSIKEQLAYHRDEIEKHGVVANINIDMKDYGNGDKVKLRQKVTEEWKKIGYHVDRQNFGYIEIDPEDIKVSMTYLNTLGEKAALLAVPKVLKRGIELPGHQNHKDRRYRTYTFAGRVIINGTPGDMAVVVRATNKYGYKTHRIVMPDGSVFKYNNAEPTTGGRAANNGPLEPRISSASINDFTRNNDKINSADGNSGNIQRSIRMSESEKADLDNFYNESIQKDDMRSAEIAVKQMALQWGAYQKPDGDMYFYHGTNADFNRFDPDKIGSSGAGSYMGYGFNFAADESMASGYGTNLKKVFLRIENPLLPTQRTITAAKLAKIIQQIENFKPADFDGDEWTNSLVWNYDSNMPSFRAGAYEKRNAYMQATRNVARTIIESAESDADIYSELSASGGADSANVISAFQKLGYDAVLHNNSDGTKLRAAIIFSPSQIKSAEIVTRDDDGNVIPLSKRFSQSEDIRYSLRTTELHQQALDASRELVQAIKDGDTERAQQIEASDATVQYSIREEDPPKKTIIAYKAFYARDGKLYPPMISNQSEKEQKVSKATSGTMKGLPTPVGVWLNADVGGIAVDPETGEPFRASTTGRLRAWNAKSGGGPGKVPSASNTLAFRPGWHLGEWPDAKQFNKNDPVTGKQKSVMPDDLVFAKCEISADVDYQLESIAYGVGSNGKFNRSQAGLPRIPTDGFYKYRTNPDPNTAPWYISGAMRVVEILDDDDCAAICAQYGVKPDERYSHKKINLADFGLKRGPVEPTTDIDAYKKNAANYANEEVLERALNDVRYTNAYRAREIDFDDPIVANEFTINKQDIEEYRRQYKAQQEQKEQRSIRIQPLTDTREFLMGLAPEDLATDAERSVLASYKAKVNEFGAAQALVEKYETDLLNEPKNATHDQTQKHYNQVEVARQKRDRIQAELDRIENSPGYAAVLAKTRKAMSVIQTATSGGNIDQYFEAMRNRLVTAEGRIDDILRDLQDWPKPSEGTTARLVFGKSQLNQQVSDLMKRNPSTLSRDEITDSLAHIALLFNIGDADSIQNATTEIQDLARKLQLQKNESIESYELTQLADAIGAFSLNDNQKKEVKRVFGSINNFKKALQGYGRYDPKAGSLDANWAEIVGMTGNQLELNTGDAQEPIALVDLISSTIQSAQAAQALSPEDQQAEYEEIQGEILMAATNMKSAIPLTREAVAAIQDFTRQFGTRVDKLDAQLMQLVSDADHARANADLAQASYTANTGNVIKGVDAIRTYYSKVADQYTREVMLQKEQELKSKYEEQLRLARSKAALKLEQSVTAYQNMLQKNRELRDLAQKIRTTRNIVRRQVMRINKALTMETNTKHVPEELKGLAEAVVQSFAKADQNGRGIILSQQECGRILAEYSYLMQRDGDLDSYEYDPDTLAMLAQLQEQLTQYRTATISGDYSDLENQRKRLEVCQNIAQVMENIGGMISMANTVFIGGQMHSVAQASEMMGIPMSRLQDFRVATGKAGNYATRLDNFVRWGNMTPYYFKRQVNNAGLTALMDDLETSEHHWGLGMQQAHDRLAEIQNNYHYYDWDDATVSISDGRGGTIELTREQAMSILAIWQREHYDENFRTYHLEEGGFVLADDGKKRGKGILGLDANPLQRTLGTLITQDEINTIQNFLTDEQKAYMKEIISYLSNDMSEIGNDTSMRLYGIKKYKEKVYFPIQSYRGGMKMKSDAGSVNPVNDKRIEHVGFSNSRLRGANNTIVISDFSTTAAGHIQQMLMYANFAPTIEALNKTMNAQWMLNNGQEVRIRQLFEMKYGKNAVGYLQEYIKSLNGGVNPDAQERLGGKLISAFKKTAVVGSLSVAAKQPMSIIRAATMINPRYLAAAAGSNLIRMHGQAAFEEAEKYAGTAVIKDIGKFDTGVGMSNVDWLLERDSTEYDLWTKAKEALNVKDWETWKARWNDILGFLPSRGDSVTWGTMWEAVKMEQHALHPSMNQNTEEFLSMCGQRFNDVMRATQVYDSTIAKSPNMRSTTTFMKTITAFMNEPVLTINMLYDAVKNAGNKNMKDHINPATAGACFMLSAVAQAVITSLFSAIRSDDKDKTILEKMAGTFGQNLSGEVNPLNMIPLVKDVVDVLEGGTIERTELSALSEAVTKVGKALSGKYAITDLRSGYRFVEDVGGNVAKVFGIPVKNLMREVRTVWNVFTQPARATNPTVFRLSLAEGLHVVPDKFFGYTLIDTSTQGYVKRMYNALRNGNEKEAADFREYLIDGKGVKEGSISSKLKSLLYEDYINERITMDDAIAFGMQNELWKKEKDAYAAIIKAADKSAHADEDEYSTTAYVNIFNALLAGDKAAYTRAVNDMTKHGYTEKGIASTAKSQIADWYKAGELDQAKAKAMLAMIGITGKNDVYWTLDSWDYQAEHGDTTGYSKYDAFIAAVASGSGLQAAIQEQVSHSDKSQKEVYSTLAGEITKAYKPKYIELVQAGRTGEAANLQARLLTAYEALGYNRAMKLKDIKKWTK